MPGSLNNAQNNQNNNNNFNNSDNNTQNGSSPSVYRGRTFTLSVGALTILTELPAPIVCIVVGMAGSGKTTLMQVF
jgi:hypothetical protein